MYTISIINQKGGVGKTTTTVNIASGIAKFGHHKKVLVVDLDSQGGATLSSGIVPTKEQATTYDVLHGKQISKAIIHTKNGYDIATGDIRLSSIDIELSQVNDRETLLLNALKQVYGKYDYCLIDCPPTLSISSIIALTASNSIVVPVKADYLTLNGLKQVLGTSELVQGKYNKQLSLLGILLTFYNDRRQIDKTIHDYLVKTYGNTVFKTTISQGIALVEAPMQGKSVFDYKHNSKASNQYESLVKEILERIEQ